MRTALSWGAGFSLLVTGCASHRAKAHVEPSTESVYSTTEFHQSNPGAMTIFVENHSSVTVRVFSVRLDDCENVRELCGPRSLDVRIPPQSRAMVVRLLARDRSRGMIYRFGFNWQVDSTKVDA